MKQYFRLLLIGVVVLSLVFGMAEFFRVEKNVTNAAVDSWQRGVSILPTSSGDFASESFKQSVRNAKAAGVNYISLIIPYVQSSATSIDVQRAANTPTDEALISAVNYIHSQGMAVMFVPHLDIYTNWSQWRADINPSDRAGWFKAYGDMLNHYADIGKAQGVEAYCIGVELLSMSLDKRNPTNTTNWLNLISQVRSRYPGKLTYSANWGYINSSADEVNFINFWGSLDFVGISAYYTFNGSNIASYVSEWDAYNKNVIRPLYEKTGKPILFTEVGYRSVTGAHSRPFDWSMQGSFNEQEQADLYEALFKYWNNYSYFQGVQLWDWKSNPNAGGQGDKDYTPQNKKAEQVMKKWFLGIDTNPPGTTTPPTGTTTPPTGTTTPPTGTTTPPTGTTTPPTGTTTPPTGSIPAPTVSATCTTYGPRIKISWNSQNQGSQGYYADVDNDTNWSNGFWNNLLPASATQVTAPDGFNPYLGASGNLNLTSKTQYKVRMYYIQSGKHSETATVTTPDCSQGGTHTGWPPAPQITTSCEANTPKARITWQDIGQGSKGYYVDIDNDNNWQNGYWNNRFPGGVYSVDAPAGFSGTRGAAGPLTLSAGKTYYVLTYAIVPGIHSKTATFTAPNCGSQPPANEKPNFQVKTLTPTDLTSTSVTLRGTVNMDGGTGHVWFEYGNNPNAKSYGEYWPWKAGVKGVDGRSTYELKVVINGLQPKTTYYYRINAENYTGGFSKKVGETITFTTK